LTQTTTSRAEPLGRRRELGIEVDRRHLVPLLLLVGISCLHDALLAPAPDVRAEDQLRDVARVRVLVAEAEIEVETFEHCLLDLGETDYLLQREGEPL
jgi:hypothetical protein